MNVVRYAFWGTVALLALKAMRNIQTQNRIAATTNEEQAQKEAAQKAAEALKEIAATASASQSLMTSLNQLAYEQNGGATSSKNVVQTSSISAYSPGQASSSNSGPSYVRSAV